MPTGRDRRHRLAVTASLLLGLLGALLGCTGTVSAVAPVPVPAAAPDAEPASMSGPVAPPAQPPGCGRGADDDGNAHPGTPPRGGSAYELLPALHHGGGSGAGALLPDRAFLDGAPPPAPPPAAPPTPVALSVLRV